MVEAVVQILDEHAQPSAWELLAAIRLEAGLESALGAGGRACWGAGTPQVHEFAAGVRAGPREIGGLGQRYARPGASGSASGVGGRRTASRKRCLTGARRRSRRWSASWLTREYAPFNNMLVKLQNPSGSFFGTQSDWHRLFGRRLKEDARPMLILAPMHPVMLVYDLDSTDGPELPAELRQFAKFEGDWDRERGVRTATNAITRDLIRVDNVMLSTTNAGFATISAGQGGMKMRIGLHDELDGPSRYGVLLHELAHVYLGHLGGDSDGWWPSRGDLARRGMEVEAEAVAYIVSRRAGLEGASPQYVSRYADDEAVLQSISLDLIAKVAGRLDEMGTRMLPKRRPRTKRGLPSRGNRR